MASESNVSIAFDPDELAGMFRAFADETRLEIVRQLLKSPSFSTELAETMGREQARISHHLGCLAVCGVVRKERSGKRMMYHLVASDLLNDLFHSILELRDAGDGTPEGCWVSRRRKESD